MAEQRAQIFTESSFLRGGTPIWGWQCFGCRDEEVGFATAATALEDMDLHLALCERRALR